MYQGFKRCSFQYLGDLFWELKIAHWLNALMLLIVRNDIHNQEHIHHG